jgi:AAA domain-containing protein
MTSTKNVRFRALWACDLALAGQGDMDWLWHGFLAPGMVTLLTSQWKSGKTTMIAALLARMKEGGMFAGLPLRPGRAVILSEESPQHWYQYNRRLAFGDQLCWFCRPFLGHRPQPADWRALQNTILELHGRSRFNLAVIDPLLHFLPAASENSATAMIDFLLTLQRFTEAGMAVWLAHHPRKGRILDGQAARGSGALPGNVDIIMEKNFYQSGDDTDRRRRIRTYSRFDQTPRRLVLELSADGTDYGNLGDFELDSFAENWKHVRLILQGERPRMTRREILKNWPPDFPAPNRGTLARWLHHAVNLGQVKKAGAGTKCEPFRYWLPEREKDPFFVWVTRREEVWREYRQALSDLGHFPPFGGIPRSDDVQAQRQAAERVYGANHPPLEDLFGRTPGVEDNAATVSQPVASWSESAAPEQAGAMPGADGSATASDDSPPRAAAPPADPVVLRLPPHARWLQGYMPRHGEAE